MRLKLIALAGMVLVAGAVALRADTVSKSVTWENEKWIPVNLTAEDIELKDVRFAVEGGIHWNPLRPGTGPQAFVQVRNTGTHDVKIAVAIALFDENGNLIGATESGNIG